MTEDWWNDVYENAALDIRDAYIQKLLNEFRYLSEKEDQTQDSASASSAGDETT